MLNIDKVHETRIDKLWKSWNEEGELEISDVFLSDQVLSLVDEQKVALESFNVEQILTVTKKCVGWRT